MLLDVYIQHAHEFPICFVIVQITSYFDGRFRLVRCSPCTVLQWILSGTDVTLPGKQLFNFVDTLCITALLLGLDLHSALLYTLERLGEEDFCLMGYNTV
jgi:hypothetical protein